MSYQEMRSVTVTMMGIAAIVVFWLIMIGRYEGLETADTDALLRFWATGVLISIPVSIGVRIVAMILLAIGYRIASGEDVPDFDDERDKLIELRVSQVGQVIFLLGFALSMVPIVLGMSVSVMFLVLIGAGILSEIVSESARIAMYRIGVAR
ncbi:MAG: hypothetical protein MI724_13825 [Spirochaetales bacterium]|nr:hypothetical protein [Spirochaetales bacterium]